jgi:hypothetical protein
MKYTENRLWEMLVDKPFPYFPKGTSSHIRHFSKNQRSWSQSQQNLQFLYDYFFSITELLSLLISI